MELKDTVFTLLRAVGVSGREGGAAACAEALLRPLVDEASIDRMGNLVGIRKNPGAKRLLLDAHLDEVGLVVTAHDEGTLCFAASGGVDARILPGLPVLVLTDPPVPGEITCLPPHILSAEEREKPFPMEKLRIDLGMTEEQAAEIPVGTMVCYATEPESMGAHRICGKSLDDRSCFAAILRTLELLKDEPLPVELVALGSVQEERTELGAVCAAFSAAPDWAVSVDVTFGDTPDSPKDRTFPLNGGPVIDVGPVLSRALSDRMKHCANRLGLSFGIEVNEGSTGTNSMAFQSAREGVPSALLSIPLRYMHTPAEVMDLRDIEATAQLLAEFVRSFGKEGAPC